MFRATKSTIKCTPNNKKSLRGKYIKNSQEAITTKIIKKRKRWRKLAGRNVIKVCCNTLKENESDSPRPNIIKNLLYMTIMYCISPHQQWSNSSCLYWMSVTLACSSEPFLPLLKTLLQPLKWGSERIMKRVIFSMGVQLTWVVAYESVPVLW